MPEKALFPMKTLRVTQGYYTDFSHKQSYALDLGGKDGGVDPVYAPFSGTIKRIRSTNGEMWLESDAPVEWADGTVDYMTVLFIHANSIPVSVNQHVPCKFYSGISKPTRCARTAYLQRRKSRKRYRNSCSY